MCPDRRPRTGQVRASVGRARPRTQRCRSRRQHPGWGRRRGQGRAGNLGERETIQAGFAHKDPATWLAAREPAARPEVQDAWTPSPCFHTRGSLRVPCLRPARAKGCAGGTERRGNRARGEGPGRSRLRPQCCSGHRAGKTQLRVRLDTTARALAFRGAPGTTLRDASDNLCRTFGNSSLVCTSDKNWLPPKQVRSSWEIFGF